jgi:hypothetical protein
MNVGHDSFSFLNARFAQFIVQPFSVINICSDCVTHVNRAILKTRAATGTAKTLFVSVTAKSTETSLKRARMERRSFLFVRWVHDVTSLA